MRSLYRSSVHMIGSIFIAGILELIGNIAIAIAVGAVVAIATAIITIWVRINQLSAETTNLTSGVNTLNQKISDLESKMKPSDIPEK